MEEGLLAQSRSKSSINGASGVVVLSTLVALCGSFGYGCAVSCSHSHFIFAFFYKES